MYATIASAAIMATSAALAQSVGSAIVINSCSYDVLLANVPAEGGGFSEDDKTLQSGDTFTQQWTELSNSQGWSIKLSKDKAFSDIMQYEYTFHNDGTIWYDLSDVNGNPWDTNWEITAESPAGTCSPKQQAYRYATDDAYGMQSCPQDSVITVTLCSGDASNDGPASSASSSVAAETSTESPATSASAYSSPSSAVPVTTSVESTPTSIESVASTTPTSSAVATSTAHSWRSHSYHQANAAATTLATSTFATSTTTSAPDGVTVVDVETAIVTEIVTATQYAKRHPHHPHHVRA